MHGVIASVGAILKGGQSYVAALAGLGGAGLGAWRFVGGRARLEPASQGRDWQRFFQAGNVWHLRVRVRNERKGVEHLKIEFASIATLDYRGKTIVERKNVLVLLEPFREAGAREELLPVGGVARREVQDREVHTVRAQGRIRTKSRAGVWLSRSFDFEMRQGSAYGGEMFERRGDAASRKKRGADCE